MKTVSQMKQDAVEFITAVEASATPTKAMPGLEGQMWLVALGMMTVDAVTDEITITTAGRLFAGLRPEGVPLLEVEKIAELKGDVTEHELAARYIDAKIAGCDHHAAHSPQDREMLHRIAVVLTEIANEFRGGLHLPELHIEGRVIHYNDSNDTGVKHIQGLLTFFTDVHERNVNAGWWTNIETGEPLKRNVGELLMLVVTELAEAYEAFVQRTPDDKLPQYPGFGVEIADALIRLADISGALAAGHLVEHSDTPNPGDKMFNEVCMIARHYESIRKTPEAKGGIETGDFIEPMDVAEMTDGKLLFNATRADHKIENRLKDDGKKT